MVWFERGVCVSFGLEARCRKLLPAAEEAACGFAITCASTPSITSDFMSSSHKFFNFKSKVYELLK
jgi:hypothetical protein